MKVGVLGSGVVARVLASGFVAHGHETRIGSRDPSKLADWVDAHAGGAAGTFDEVSAFGDVIVLAVKGTAALNALELAGADAIAGKTIIDATNPIADAPPTDGVLEFFTDQNDSLMERLQAARPAANFVKAFSSVSNLRMVNPAFDGGPPTMFICGNDKSAKEIVTRILDQFGWETADMGSVVAARTIEPLCMLYCIPGFTENQWTHAFKLLR